MDIEKRKKWSLLRYNYYSSGRNEMLIGNYSAAGILLGYAIETSFKHALIESGFDDKKILKEHNPRILMKACRKIGILKDIEVSDDFLDYINDHLKPRYPSFIDEVQKNIFSKGRADIIGPLLLSWYDDLMFEIDSWLFGKTSDNLSSCFFRATDDINLLKGKLFFHANFHACSNINQLIEMRKNHLGNNSLFIAELEKGIKNFWSTVSGVMPAQSFDNVKYVKNFSKRFYYCKWSKGENISIQIKNWNCIMINLLPWE